MASITRTHCWRERLDLVEQVGVIEQARKKSAQQGQLLHRGFIRSIRQSCPHQYGRTQRPAVAQKKRYGHLNMFAILLLAKDFIRSNSAKDCLPGALRQPHAFRCSCGKRFA